jgi:hypothetical protein
MLEVMLVVMMAVMLEVLLLLLVEVVVVVVVVVSSEIGSGCVDSPVCRARFCALIRPLFPCVRAVRHSPRMYCRVCLRRRWQNH